MTPGQQFSLELLKEFRAWFGQILAVLGPALLAWHLPQPKYMDKDAKPTSDSK